MVYICKFVKWNFTNVDLEWIRRGEWTEWTEWTQYMLGCMHADGEGTPVNRREGLRWILKAAEQGHCDAQVSLGYAPFSADRNGYHISWESVPAWVCTQCGEALFEENEVNHIQKALQEVDRETEALLARHA